MNSMTDRRFIDTNIAVYADDSSAGDKQIITYARFVSAVEWMGRELANEFA